MKHAHLKQDANAYLIFESVLQTQHFISSFDACNLYKFLLWKLNSCNKAIEY